MLVNLMKLSIFNIFFMVLFFGCSSLNQDLFHTVESPIKAGKRSDSSQDQIQEKSGVQIASYKINDGSTGLASGNGNGIPENGETIELVLYIKNNGVGTAVGVRVSIASIDSGIDIRQGIATIPKIYAGQTATVSLALAIQPTFSAREIKVDLIASDTRGVSQTNRQLAIGRESHQPIPTPDTPPLISIVAPQNMTGPRVALVIGNEKYKRNELVNPSRDVMDMANVLERCGFEVIKKVNATRIEMREAIRQFSSTLRRGGVGLFYYSGHGIQVDGENYLIPIDADVTMRFEVQDQCVNAASVLKSMEEAGSTCNIIILDACRDNPFRSWVRSAEGGLAKMDAATGSFIAYATAPGKVAEDGEPGRNGLYTSCLLKHMVCPGLKIWDVFMRVRVDVIRASNNKQVPWETSSLTGDFCFIP